jgi:hypothetical protein
MGLDQYLHAKRAFYSQDNADVCKVVSTLAGIPHDDDAGGVVVTVSIGYWRKANQIHHWMVENVQQGQDDCGQYMVTREDMGRLLDLCLKVQADPEQAPELLPSAPGFFFGSLGYDEWYHRQIQHTVEVLQRALALPQGVGFYYSSSW